MSCGCGSGCKCGSCIVCKILSALVALVMTYVMVAALLGAWTATVGFSMLSSSSASLPLLTLAVSAMIWLKMVKKLCPCGKKMCGCGGGMPGACPMCGKNPCVCNK